MTSYVALLRAINVGGTGKLSMTDLRRLCEQRGFQKVATYIQSGNVVFDSHLSELQVKQTLENVLAAQMGKPFSALVRSASELSQIAKSNPFPDAAPNQVLVLFLAEIPPSDCLSSIVVPGREQLVLRGREVFVHYPDGMGRSKLKLPFQKNSTGRNLNTVNKLVAMVEK